MKKSIKYIILLALYVPLFGVTTAKTKAEVHALMQEATKAYQSGNKSTTKRLLEEADTRANALNLSQDERAEFGHYMDAMPGVCDDPGVCLQKCCNGWCCNN